ncbi:TPA: CPBP family intramembrane metalloprotease [Candidatus Poribacteria bacterium]|nr:CPBP family intramembrane metalloprotease [Candidatus Poribacteria bacterium]
MRKSTSIESFRAIGTGTGFILILTPVFLTIHAYFARPNFFGRRVLPWLFRSYPSIASSNHAGALAYYYWFAATSISLLTLPLLSAYLIPGEKYLGFKPQRVKLGLIAVLALYLLMLPFLFLASRSLLFQARYPLCKSAAAHPDVLIVYELLYGLYMFSWEFFFRGYMLFGLERDLGGGYAVLIQTIPFVLMHVGKPLPEALGSVFAGVILGVLALETRTFIFGALLHWMIAASLDLMVIGKGGL